jgi:tetratricopeptide (TPR) repeat protein
MSSRLPALVACGVFLAVGCSAQPAPYRHPSPGGATAANPPLFDNLGRHHRAITTTSPQAQAYFDQGRRLVYGFNHAEAQAAFREAARLDPTAVKHLAEAVRMQDEHWFTEPPPWYYPVRQSLGAALHQAGRAAEAEAVYREDLRRNPENGWSLFGLAQGLRAQGKTADAAGVDERFRRAWARADVTLTASRF